MKAVAWHGKRDVRVDTFPDPSIEQPTDAIVRITSTAICGSDLHLYEVLGPFIDEGDILGHEPMGIVEEVGSEVSHIKPGDRIVVPFNIACGHCWMCDRQLFALPKEGGPGDQGRAASLTRHRRGPPGHLLTFGKPLAVAGAFDGLIVDARFPQRLCERRAPSGDGSGGGE